MRVCIVGTSRCGTTVMREILHAHPDLAVLNETHWLPRMFEFVGRERVDWRILFDIAARTSWDSGEDLFSVNRAGTAHADTAALVEALRSELAKRSRVTIQEFSAAFAEVCFGPGRTWGDKTPDYGFHMGLLKQLWPECRFLHMVRDGLDTARSMSRHPGCQLMVSAGYDNWCSLSYDRLHDRYVRRELPLEAYVASWCRRMRRIRDEASRLRPGSYLEVRYEDLQDAPRETLLRVADWMALPPSDSWLGAASAMVRPRSGASGSALGLLRRLDPDELLYLNAQGRRPELRIPHDADAASLSPVLRSGQDAATRGDHAEAARAALSLLATERARADPEQARAAVDLLVPALSRDGEDEAARRWTAWVQTAAPVASGPGGGAAAGRADRLASASAARGAAGSGAAPLLCMMMCVRDEADTILDHLLYHRFLGVGRAYVFLDSGSDGAARLLEGLPWVVTFHAPRAAGVRHLTTHQVACARLALERARRDGIPWLLHLDPDEYAWADNSRSGDPKRDASLLELIGRAGGRTELIRLQTREAIPVRGERSFPLWRQEFFQVQPHVFERDILDPSSGEVRRLAKWIGHNQGKSLVRTEADVVPETAHTWRRGGSAAAGSSLVTEWLGFHYHFVVGDALSWRRKYRKLAWEAPVWENGAPVPFPKQAWKEASLSLDESRAAAYYERWVAVAREQAEALVRAGKAERDRRLWAVMEAMAARDREQAWRR